MAAKKTKTKAEVHKMIMKKEWSMSKCTPLSLERLVRIGVLHAQELAGWRAPDLEPFLDPKGGEIVVFFKNTLLTNLVFLYIHSCKGSVTTMRSTFAICIQILCCLFLASSISTKHTVVSNPTSTIFVTYFG
jgi:hypothetical protein